MALIVRLPGPWFGLQFVNRVFLDNLNLRLGVRGADFSIGGNERRYGTIKDSFDK
jgi:hypothetical protein